MYEDSFHSTQVLIRVFTFSGTYIAFMTGLSLVSFLELLYWLLRALVRMCNPRDKEPEYVPEPRPDTASSMAAEINSREELAKFVIPSDFH